MTMRRSERGSSCRTGTTRDALDWVEAELRSVADADRAVQEQRYLKSQRPFYGCGMPTVRRIAKAALREFHIDSREQFEPIVDALWAGEPFEHRAVAVEMLAARVRLLELRDLPWFRRWIADGETWAIVDRLSIAVVGEVVARDPDAALEVLDAWSTDESFWVRRASMLALLPSLRDSDRQWGQFCRYAESMMAEREFFIRKAIGWVTREVAKRRPDTARPWVEHNLDHMSGVTRREATKYL